MRQVAYFFSVAIHIAVVVGLTCLNYSMLDANYGYFTCIVVTGSIWFLFTSFIQGFTGININSVESSDTSLTEFHILEGTASIEERLSYTAMNFIFCWVAPTAYFWPLLSIILAAFAKFYI